jgi:transcriptional regulator with XRE-family HTH domain
MTCPACGAKTDTRRENFSADNDLLPPGVVLLDIEIAHCANCGKRWPRIDNAAKMWRTVALGVIRRRRRLRGSDVVWLRKVQLGWSGVELARHLGVTPEHLNRLEHGVQEGSPVLDRLLRLLVAVHARVRPKELDLEVLTSIADKPDPLANELIRVRATKTGWELVESDDAV